MKLQKDLTLKNCGQLEFDAPQHVGASRIMNKTVEKRTFKKHIDLLGFGLEVDDVKTLDKY